LQSSFRGKAAGGHGPAWAAVLFDLGGTLVHLDYAWLAAAAASLGASLDEGAMALADAAVRREGWEDPAAPLLNPTQRMFRGYLGAVGRRVGLPEASALAFADAAYAEHGRRPLGLWHSPDAEARPVLEALRARGVRTGVVSNNDGRARAQVEAVGLAPLLEVVVDSRTAGVRKPDPAIFAAALAALAIRAASCLYVGDSYRDDVVGARAAGLTPVLYDPLGLRPDADVATVGRLWEVLALALGPGA
jgi:putative hydrolase of the HAD superfamily